MKKILLVFLLVFSFGLFSCEDEPKVPKFDKSVIKVGDFFISGNIENNKISIYWICDLMRDDKNIYWKEGGKKISDLKYVLKYDTRVRELSDVEYLSDIGTLDPETVIVLDNVTSPYLLNGLESGKKYYFTLEAFIEADVVAYSRTFSFDIP